MGQRPIRYYRSCLRLIKLEFGIRRCSNDKVEDIRKVKFVFFTQLLFIGLSYAPMKFHLRYEIQTFYLKIFVLAINFFCKWLCPVRRSSGFDTQISRLLNILIGIIRLVGEFMVFSFPPGKLMCITLRNF